MLDVRLALTTAGRTDARCAQPGCSANRVPIRSRTTGLAHGTELRLIRLRSRLKSCSSRSSAGTAGALRCNARAESHGRQPREHHREEIGRPHRSHAARTLLQRLVPRGEGALASIARSLHHCHRAATSSCDKTRGLGPEVGGRRQRGIAERVTVRLILGFLAYLAR